MQSWMLVVQTPVAKSNSSKVRKCIGTKKSNQQYGIACRHKHVITCSMHSSSTNKATETAGAWDMFLLKPKKYCSVAELEHANKHSYRCCRHFCDENLADK